MWPVRTLRDWHDRDLFAIQQSSPKSIRHEHNTLEGVRNVPEAPAAVQTLR
jgi:hypothetical protein